VSCVVLQCELQCVAVSCSVLQCVVLGFQLNEWNESCRVLQRVAVCCSELQCVAVCCSVLQCVAVCCTEGFVFRVKVLVFRLYRT